MPDSLCCPVKIPHTVGGKALAELENGLKTVTESPSPPHDPGTCEKNLSLIVSSLNVCNSRTAYLSHCLRSIKFGNLA